ncbi:MAG TPA: hypothetical protein VE994_01360 [Terriglobales bacterium]|nr:hypothetical protein [Terriglobales bacterium]
MKIDAEQTFIKTIAAEMSAAVCEAVGYWMADVDAALADESTSAPDKVNRIRNIVAAYKARSEKRDLPQRPVPTGMARRASVSNAI